MDALQKLALLSENMRLEPAEETSISSPACAPIASGSGPGIFHASLPGGGKKAILKTLLTSVCERDCFYCPFRAGRDHRRASFRPTEMADLFSQLNRKGHVDGLFLSSGIAGGGVRVQDQLITTAELLRKQKGFRGYLHLKLIPGADRAQLLRAMQLADRVSINLEAPNPQRLSQLAPHKIFFEELLEPLKWANEIRQTEMPDQRYRQTWPSLVTQFVVGPAGENDLELLTTSEYLFKNIGLARVYYSAFSPIIDTPLEETPPENPMRELRLYQASFLLRDYGFSTEELPFEPSGRLPLNKDPKLAWAEQNLLHEPVDINQVSREELLRVPGIGVKGAAAILASRRRHPIRSNADLLNLGISVKRSSAFILLNGKRPAFQPALW